MARRAPRPYRTIVIHDRVRLNQEYIEARHARLRGTPRIIRNPRGAAAVKMVIDQIPLVKLDLDIKFGPLKG